MGRRWWVVAAVVLAVPPLWSIPRAAAASRYLDEMFQVDVQRDVVYGSAPSPDGSGAMVDLTLDVYTPRGDALRDRPAFVYAHGGAFLVGDKADGDPTGWATRMARRGYVAASINYRLGPNLVTPPVDDADRAQIHRARFDMQNAVRWLKANSAALGIDPERIAVAGSSAGAITALGVALNSDSQDSIPTPPTASSEWSASVCTAVSISGANDPLVADAGDASAIFFHGTNDGFVPFDLAVATRDAMERSGLPVSWNQYAGEGHVGDGFSAATVADIRAKTVQWVYERVANASFPCSAAVAARAPIASGQKTVLTGSAGRSAVMALVAVDTRRAAFVQALGCGDAPGATANVNADAPGQIRSNLAVVPFAADGRACLYNNAPTHLVADLQGYFAPGAFEDVADVRLLDTRTGDAVPARSQTVVNGRPSSTGVVSVVAIDGAGWFQFLPCGGSPGESANLHTDASPQPRGALAFVRFDSDGRVCLFNSARAHLVVDLQGYMEGTAFDDVADSRLIDTRDASAPPVPAGSQTVITGRPNTTAVIALFAVDTAGAGYLQVLPCGAAPGASANLNADARGQIVAGVAFVRFDADGRACVHNQMGTHLVVDLQGYMQPGAFDDGDDVRLRDTRVR